MPTWHIRDWPLSRRHGTPHRLICGLRKESNLRKQWESPPRCKEERDRNGHKERNLYLQREGGSLDMRTFLRGKITLLFMLLGLLVAIPAIALADIIHDQVNNIDVNVPGPVGEPLPLTVNGTKTVKYWVERVNPASGTDPDGGCNIDAGEQLYIKITSASPAVANALAGQGDVTELKQGTATGLYVGPFTNCDDPATVNDPVTGLPIREGEKSAV